MSPPLPPLVLIAVPRFELPWKLSPSYGSAGLPRWAPP
jgi:hypothetical protein